MRLTALCFDANDPHGLARFWAAALGWEVGEETPGAVALVPTDGTRFTVVFRPIEGPKVGKNRIHIDLTTVSLDDQRDSVSRLIELGGQHIDIGQLPEEGHVVLADPEGNELCVLEPNNSFLAGTGRFGSITCDGSPAAGHFWSAALGWPLVWDQDEETAIRVPEGADPLITWGPPVEPMLVPNRLHLELAAEGAEGADEIAGLVARGATRLEGGQHGRAVLADPDGNEFWVQL